MFRKSLLSLSALLSVPMITLAHSGHGTFHGQELGHYLASPGHAIPVALVLVASVLLIAFRKRIWAKHYSDKE